MLATAACQSGRDRPSEHQLTLMAGTGRHKSLIVDVRSIAPALQHGRSKWNLKKHSVVHPESATVDKSRHSSLVSKQLGGQKFCHRIFQSRDDLWVGDIVEHDDAGHH